MVNHNHPIFMDKKKIREVLLQMNETKKYITSDLHTYINAFCEKSCKKELILLSLVNIILE